jgi:hypothetical protein
MNPEKQEDLAHIKEKIKQYIPLVVDFLENNDKLIDYSRKLYELKADPIHLERQKACTEIINNKLKTLYNEQEIKNFNLNFEKGIVSNIVDHHNILNHPLLVSGLIISNINNILNSEKKGILVLSCAGVPFNNKFHKCGFTFKNEIYPYVTRKDRHRWIHHTAPREINFIAIAKNKDNYQKLLDNEKQFLEKYQDQINKIDYHTCKSFSDQITLLNHKLFQEMFEDKLKNKIPELIYFEQEHLAKELLIKLIEEGINTNNPKNNFVYEMLFNPKFRTIVLNNFEGIWGAWNTKDNLGTHFFWSINEEDEVIQLKIEGDYLISTNNNNNTNLKIKLDPLEIIKQIKDRKLYPNLQLTFGILTFYCGIKPLTGPGSMNYLTDMKNAWVKTMIETNNI